MLRIFLYSIFIGAGGIAPGLSGGTLSIILGVHRKIIDAIGCLFKKPMDSFKVLIPASFGALVGVIIFSAIQSRLLVNYQMQTLFCFIGLMLGSLPFLFKEANSIDPLSKKNITLRLPLFLIAIVIGLLMVFFDNFYMPNNTIDIIRTTDISWSMVTIATLIMLGILISASLVIPGISGTVLLIMIGQYTIVLGLLAGLKDFFINPNMDVFNSSLPLLPIGIGVLIGIFLFSRLLSYLFFRWHGATYATIFGFIVGSVPALYPTDSNFEFNLDTISSLILFLLGFMMSYLFGIKGMRLKDK